MTLHLMLKLPSATWVTLKMLVVTVNALSLLTVMLLGKDSAAVKFYIKANFFQDLGQGIFSLWSFHNLAWQRDISLKQVLLAMASV